MQRLYGWEVEPEEIIPIPNVNIGMRIAASIAIRKGNGVVIQPPVFYELVKFPLTYGWTRQDAPLRRSDHGHVVRYDIDRGIFERAIHSGGAKTTLFLLCNPHNPVGRVYSPDELEWMANVCSANDIYICSDDIHNELVLGNAKYVPIATRSPQIAERTITLIGPGKIFNVSGLGCAFAVISSASIRTQFSAEAERLGLMVSSPGLTAARAAYSGDCDEWLSELRNYLTANRDYIVEYIVSELPGVHTTVPDATYLAWLDCGEYLQTGKITGSPQSYFLEVAKVALEDGKAFGPTGERFVRLNFACPRSVLEESLTRIRKALI
jgi:cystathionine beta-lyase